MARIKLEIPARFHFTTEIKVRISDINYGNHLGNDSLVSILHQARIDFLKNWSYSEMNIEGVGLIMSDLAVQFKNEAFEGDILSIEIAAIDFGLTSFDLFYLLTRKSDQKIIAIAKTNMVCYDYHAHKMKDVPEKFRSLFVP